jgi:hypothetical protein
MSSEQGDRDPTRPGAVAAGKVEGDPTRTAPGPDGVEAAPGREDLPDDPELLRTKIDETRAELGDTVEALTAKADVKGQVKEKVEDKKEQLRGRAKANPVPFAVGGVGALLALILLRRGRR